MIAHEPAVAPERRPAVAAAHHLESAWAYPGMIAAYNAGPGRYTAYLARHQPLPAETVAYLNAVTRQAKSTAITSLTQPRELMFVLRRDLSSAAKSGTEPSLGDGLFAVQPRVP